MHNQPKFLILLTAIIFAVTPIHAQDAKVADLQQKLQQALNTEAEAKAKLQEAQKAFSATVGERQKLEQLKKDYYASAGVKTDGWSPEQIRAQAAKIEQLQKQVAAAEQELKKKSLPVNRALTDAKWAAAQASGTTKGIQAELAKAQSQTSAGSTARSEEKNTTATSAAAKSPAAASASSKSPAAAEQVTVPDLSLFDGLGEMQAVARHAGLKPTLVPTDATPEPGKKSLFHKQHPERGTKANKDDTLQIFHFKKPIDTVDVPSLIGLTLEQAQSRLKSNMTITSDEVGDKPPTPEQALTIFEQNPAPNAMIPSDQKIVVAVKRYGSAQSDKPAAEETSTPATSEVTSAQAQEALFGEKTPGTKSTPKSKTTTTKKRELTPEEKRARAQEWFRQERARIQREGR